LNLRFISDNFTNCI